MPNNKSQNIQKIILSPGQALLIIIDKYQNELKYLLKKPQKNILTNIEIKNLKNNLKKLYLLYLCGIKNKKDSLEFKKLISDKSLLNYEVSYDYKVIDNDPTRRYFETHLAATTLKYNLENLNIEDLKDHYQSLYNLLSEIEKKMIAELFSGLCNVDNEYTSILKSLNTTPCYKEASELDKEKMNLLIKCSYLGVINITSLVSTISFPLDIYKKGFFSKEARGVKYLSNQSKVRSNHLGIIKSYMPLPLNDTAYREGESSTYLRAADEKIFDYYAKWVHENFKLLTQPFSGSISGTVLCQLRTSKYLLEQSSFYFKKSKHFTNFMQCFISTLLYQTGGHSLHEYVSVLTLPEVIKTFNTSSIQGFESLDKKKLFFKKNKLAFYQALDETITYHNILLKKEKLHNEIKYKKNFLENKYLIIKNEKLINKLINKNEFDNSTCISNYINEKFYEIDIIAKKNGLSSEEVTYLRHKFLKRLAKIDFSDPKIKRKFKYDENIGLILSQNDFLSYIHSDEIAPELKNIDKFSCDNILSPTLRNIYLKKIEAISNLIASYQNSNEKHLIDEFNIEIKKKYDYIKGTIQPDIARVQKELINLLQKIEAKRSRCNSIPFFYKILKKSHISLKEKINDAKKIVAEFSSPEEELSKSTRPKI